MQVTDRLLLSNDKTVSSHPYDSGGKCKVGVNVADNVSLGWISVSALRQLTRILANLPTVLF